MEQLLTVLAPDFTLTLDGESSAIAREGVAAYYETSRKRVTYVLSCILQLTFKMVQLKEQGGPDSSHADYRKIRKITAKEVRKFLS